MKTTQLIDLLKKYECGAVTGRPREVYFEVDDRIIKTDGIEFIEAGDGLVTDLTLSLPDAKPHWIPCSERLPEEKDAGILKKLGTGKRSEYVLATVEVKGERMTVTACTYDGKWDWNMKYAFPAFKVVAWMPLPEPWKGDKK